MFLHAIPEHQSESIKYSREVFGPHPLRRKPSRRRKEQAGERAAFDSRSCLQRILLIRDLVLDRSLLTFVPIRSRHSLQSLPCAMTVQPQYLPTPVPTPPPGGLVASSASLINKKKQPTPPYLPNRHDYNPTHPDLFKIEFGPEGEEFGSCLRAQKVRGQRLFECIVSPCTGADFAPSRPPSLPSVLVRPAPTLRPAVRSISTLGLCEPAGVQARRDPVPDP